MNNRAKGAVLFLASIIFLNIFFAFKGYEIPKIKEEKKFTFYVDSVWSKGPGEINTLQMDRIYFGRTTDGKVHSSRSEISVGDSFLYIYRRY